MLSICQSEHQIRIIFRSHSSRTHHILSLYISYDSGGWGQPLVLARQISCRNRRERLRDGSRSSLLWLHRNSFVLCTPCGGGADWGPEQGWQMPPP